MVGRSRCGEIWILTMVFSVVRVESVAMLRSVWLSRNYFSNPRAYKAQRRVSYLTMQAGAPTKKVAIIGGGLAGLSTAFHLLEKTKEAAEFSSVHITIIDKAPVGTGGASSVAGGLIHPLSPRGKLVHWGLEGLESTNRLIEAASKHAPHAVLRNELYRVALTDQNVQQLQRTATQHPEFCEWLDANSINRQCCTKSSLGGLRLTNGCRAIHVPSYLQGLWSACVELSNGTAEWLVEHEACQLDFDWKNHLATYDYVVLSAGSALWQDCILSTKKEQQVFPVDLIRGQSIAMKVPANNRRRQQQAVLCGKYISPMLEDDKVLIGATHEFQAEPLSPDEVASTLRERSYELAPELWDEGSIDTVTSGYRVQSRRGAFGRMPIVGRLDTDIHHDAWIFTGLSSRGLLYHGIYGDVLTDALLEQDEANMLAKYSQLNWWRETSTTGSKQ